MPMIPIDDRKPILVWVILLWTIWGLVSIVGFYAGISELEGVPSEMVNALKRATLLEHVLKISHGALSLLAALALFRLRPLALPLFAGFLLCRWFKAQPVRFSQRPFA
jgi:hypothetical protein